MRHAVIKPFIGQEIEDSASLYLLNNAMHSLPGMYQINLPNTTGLTNHQEENRNSFSIFDKVICNAQTATLINIYVITVGNLLAF